LAPEAGRNEHAQGPDAKQNQSSRLGHWLELQIVDDIRVVIRIDNNGDRRKVAVLKTINIVSLEKARICGREMFHLSGAQIGSDRRG